jgi:hypothetical protein
MLAFESRDLGPAVVGALREQVHREVERRMRPRELFEVDPAELSRAVGTVLAQEVGRELRSQLNALRGRVD